MALHGCSRELCGPPGGLQPLLKKHGSALTALPAIIDGKETGCILT